MGVIPGTWIEQGPNPIYGGANVAVTSKPQVGGVSVIIPHPDNANIIWVGSTNGGIWKTTNATTQSPTWTTGTDNAPSLSISALDLDITPANDPANNYRNLVAGIGRVSSFSNQAGQLTGLLLSEDGGTTWRGIGQTTGSTPRAVSLAGKDITGVIIRGDTILAVAKDGGFFYSIDKGTNFFLERPASLPNFNFEQTQFTSLVGDPANDYRFYAASIPSGNQRGAVFQIDITSNGFEWKEISSIATAIQNVQDVKIGVAVKPADHLNPAQTVLYYGVIGNVRPGPRSTEDKLKPRLAQLVRVDNPGAGTQQTLTSLALPESIDGGESYGLHPSGQGDSHFGLTVHPKKPDIIYLSGDTQPVIGSENSVGASTWTGRVFRGQVTLGQSNTPTVNWAQVVSNKANNTASHADSRGLAIDKDGNLLDAGDGGLYKLTKPGEAIQTWSSLNGTVTPQGSSGGLRISELHSIDYDSITKILLVGAQDNGVSEGLILKQGAASRTYAWQERSSGDGGRVRVEDLDPKRESSYHYYSSQSLDPLLMREITFTTNGTIGTETVIVKQPALTVSGTKQKLQDYEKDVLKGGMPFVTPLELNKVAAGQLIIGGTKGVYESTNRGETVTVLKTDLPATVGLGAIAYGGRENGQDKPNVLYVGTEQFEVNENGLVKEKAQLLLRPAEGGTLTPTKYQGQKKIMDIVLDPKDWKIAYVLDENTVWRTTDQGENWVDITGDLVTNNSKLVQNRLNTIEYVPGTTDGQERLLVGGLGGVYTLANPKTVQQGQGIWNAFKGGLPSQAVVYELNYDSHDDVLVAATLGRGAWAFGDVKAALAGSSPDLNKFPIAIARTREVKVSNAQAYEKVSYKPQAIADREDYDLDDADESFDSDELEFDAEREYEPGMLFEIDLGAPSDQRVVLRVQTVDGTAVAGRDYEPIDTLMTFDPGLVTEQVLVPIIDDPEFEPNQDFSLKVSLVEGSIPITDAEGLATITEDLEDVPSTPTPTPTPVPPPPPPVPPTLSQTSTPTPSTPTTPTGTTGNDRINGTFGNDTISGFQGADTMNGNDGNDVINGNQDDDVINGGAGNDVLAGGKGNDAVNGGIGNDVLRGDRGSDTLIGDAGDDLLFGGKGNDILNGGEGNDTLSGDRGADLLTGGAGSDLFVLRQSIAVTDLALTDFITDFQVGIDRIGLTGGLTAANLSLTLLGNNTIIGIAGTNQILGIVANINPDQLTGSFATANIGVA